MTTSSGFLLFPPTLKQFLFLAQNKGCILEGIHEINRHRKKKNNTSQIPHGKGEEDISRQVCTPKGAIGLAWWWKGGCIIPGITQCLCGENWKGKKKKRGRAKKGRELTRYSSSFRILADYLASQTLSQPTSWNMLALLTCFPSTVLLWLRWYEAQLYIWYSDQVLFSSPKKIDLYLQGADSFLAILCPTLF